MKTPIRALLVVFALLFTLPTASADQSDSYWPGKSDDYGFPVDPPPNYRQRFRVSFMQPRMQPRMRPPTRRYTVLPRQVQRNSIAVGVPSIASPYIAASYRASTCSR
ncbi:MULTISPECIES: hypothetical protein [Rhodopirellula]|uniref:Secreted protein n=1 Tax=Rhodopirellula bahusiensis TaxID=2014065 RepID=A0A2G1VZ65_9BACT|nr:MULTISPECIES: hypothetical protein [Rhodopirellula]PHQ32086.1 hypothetical protein CEE69_27855 [Rhodopirellula bahusiensis]